MKAEDILNQLSQDEGFGDWNTVVLNCHHSVITSIATAAVNQALLQPPVSGSLPTLVESKKAMLKRKIKFVDTMDRFSSRKNAYKKGWLDCYNWITSKGNDH